MFLRIKKMYQSNPILFVHIAGILHASLVNILLEVFRLAVGWEVMPQIVRDVFILGWTSGFFIWLGAVSWKCCKKHKEDEVKLTYIVLKLYSFATSAAGIAIIICLIVMLISGE